MHSNKSLGPRCADPHMSSARTLRSILSQKCSVDLSSPFRKRLLSVCDDMFLVVLNLRQRPNGQCASHLTEPRCNAELAPEKRNCATAAAITATHCWMRTRCKAASWHQRANTFGLMDEHLVPTPPPPKKNKHLKPWNNIYLRTQGSLLSTAALLKKPFHLGDPKRIHLS